MYPDDSIQALIDPWWVQPNKAGPVAKGDLVWTFVAYPEPEPRILLPQGRTEDATAHTKAIVRIEVHKIGQPVPKPSGLPVAGLPLFEGESYFVTRGKIRPAVVVSTGGIDASQFKARGAPWQTKPAVLVAPYYGVPPDGSRGGWNPELVERIQKAEYPQFVWDILPPPSKGGGSILRLDHTFAMGNNPNTHKVTGYRLSDEAMSILEQWLCWLVTGTPGDELAYYRAELLKLDELEE